MQNKNQVFILSGLVAVALLAVGVTTYSLSSGGQNGQVNARPAAKAAETVAATDTCTTEVKPFRIAAQFRDGHSYRDNTQGFEDGLQAILGPCWLVDIDEPDVAVGTSTLNEVKKLNADGVPTGNYEAMLALPGSGGSLPGSPSVAENGGSLIAETFTSGLPFYFEPQQHADWMFHGGGMQLEQSMVNKLIGNNLVKVFPVGMSASEHGMFWKEKIPSTLEEAKTYFGVGKNIRFFGNGGRLASKLFGFTQLSVSGLTPYQLMMDNSVIGVDFTTPKGDLYDFFGTNAGINILANLATWTCDTIPPIKGNVGSANEGPLRSTVSGSGCPNVAQLGYKNFYAKGWHQDYDIFDLTVNHSVWTSLSDTQKNAILALAEKNMKDGRLAEVQETPAVLQQIKAMVEAAEGNYFSSTWPSAVMNFLKQNAPGYYENLAVLDPGSATKGGFGEVLTSMKNFLPYHPASEEINTPPGLEEKCPLVPGSTTEQDTCVVIQPQDPINVGVMLRSSTAVQVRNGVELALETTSNAPLTVDGHPLKMVFRADGCDESSNAVAEAGANDLVAQNVVGVIGNTCSGRTQAINNILSPLKIFMFSPSATRIAFTAPGSPLNFFARAFNDKAQGLAAAKFVYNKFYTTTHVPTVVVIKNTNNTFPEGLSSQFIQDFESLGGVVREIYPISCLSGTPTSNTFPDCSNPATYAAILSDVETDGQVDLIYGPFANVNEQVGLVKAVKARLEPTWLKNVPVMGGDSVNNAAFITAAGVNAEGFYASGAPAISSPFSTLWENRYGTLTTSPKPEPFSPIAYDEAKILIKAINAVKQVMPSGALLIPRTALYQKVLNTTGANKYTGYAGTYDCKKTGYYVGDCLNDAVLNVSKVMSCTVGTDAGCVSISNPASTTGPGMRFWAQ